MHSHTRYKNVFSEEKKEKYKKLKEYKYKASGAHNNILTLNLMSKAK